MNEVHSAYSASASAVSGIKEVIQLTHCPSGRLSLSLSLPVCVCVCATESVRSTAATKTHIHKNTGARFELNQVEERKRIIGGHF